MSVQTCCSLKITAMIMADYDQVIAFWTGKEGIGMSESDSPEQVAMFLARNPGLSLVARDGQRIVGAVLCGHDGRRAMLYHLAVDPAYRKRGLGRELVDRCIAALAQQQIQKCNIVVYADNHEGQRFWKRVGFDGRCDLTLMQRSMTEAPLAGKRCTC